MANYSLVENNGFKAITAFVDGELLTITSEHPHFDKVLERCQLDQTENLSELFNPVEKITKAFAKIGEQVAIKDGRVLFEGSEVAGLISDHILRFYEEGVDDYEPIVKFLEKINQNPQQESREMAYEWINQAGLTINADGDVVGYKGVDSEYRSHNAGPAIVNGVEMNGHVPNEPGNVIEMVRADVTFDPYNSCASGLHVGTYTHARSFAGSNGIMLELAVNPRDIVSVPSHDTTKMRVCRYRVVGEIDAPRTEAYVDYGYESSYDDFEDFEDDWDEEESEVSQDDSVVASTPNWWSAPNPSQFVINNFTAKADTTKNHLAQLRGPDGKFIKKGN